MLEVFSGNFCRRRDEFQTVHTLRESATLTQIIGMGLFDEEYEVFSHEHSKWCLGAQIRWRTPPTLRPPYLSYLPEIAKRGFHIENRINGDGRNIMK